MKDTCQPISMRVGEELEIRLKSNPTTGYKWTLRGRPDGDVVEVTGTAFIAPDDSRMGAPGEELWRVKAVGKGKTSMSLEYRRSFEPDKPPADSRTFQLIVE